MAPYRCRFRQKGDTREAASPAPDIPFAGIGPPGVRRPGGSRIDGIRPIRTVEPRAADACEMRAGGVDGGGAGEASLSRPEQPRHSRGDGLADSRAQSVGCGLGGVDGAFISRASEVARTSPTGSDSCRSCRSPAASPRAPPAGSSPPRDRSAARRASGFLGFSQLDWITPTRSKSGMRGSSRSGRVRLDGRERRPAIPIRLR